MELQKAVPNIIPVFDLKACLACNGRVSQPFLYVSAEEKPYSKFAVKTLVEDYLRNEPMPDKYPRIEWGGIKFNRGPLERERDQLYEAGYSILSVQHGYGPTLHWGCPGDSDEPVFLTDLMCMGTIIKTLVHGYQTDAKLRFARAALQFPALRLPDIWLKLMGDLVWEIDRLARSYRIKYGTEPLFSGAEDSDVFIMTWRSPYRVYRLRVDCSELNIKIQVNAKLWHAFNNCFGPDVTQWLHTDFSEV